MKRHDDCIAEGYEAAARGKPLKGNPYEVGDLTWAAWRDGWAMGRRDRLATDAE